MVRIKQEIAQMVEVDQKLRRAENIDIDELGKLDRANTERLKQIVAQIGWPKISEFGEQTSREAWLLAQHADHDPDFQEYCLGLMNELPSGEVSRRNIAYLTDRILVKKKGVQRYGTQFYDKGKYTVLRQVEDSENLNNLRAKMDLEPIEEYIKIHAEATGIPAYRDMGEVPAELQVIPRLKI